MFRLLLISSAAISCFHCVASQRTQTATTINGTNTVTTVTETWANSTQRVSETTCPQSGGSCTTVITWVYPVLGPCYFRQYRIRWLPTNTDITQVPVITEVMLLTVGADGSDEIVANGIVTLAGKAFPNIWSQPEDLLDTYNTSFTDPELRPVLISFVGGAFVNKVCLTLGRYYPSALVAIDGTMSTDTPDWKVRLYATTMTESVCYQLESDCDLDVDVSVPSETFLFHTPPNFQLRETQIGSGVYVPVPCAQYGACLFNGTCYDYGSGTLCNQCTFGGVDGATTNGTRLREGELCDICFAHWVPWVKLVCFYILWWLFVSGVAFVQYRAIRAPMFSPAFKAEAKVKEKEAQEYRKKLAKAEAEVKRTGRSPEHGYFHLDVDESDKEIQDERVTTISPVLTAGIIRHVMDHHVLCCLAWEYSGLALCFPTEMRQINFAVNMDWWNILSMQCAMPTFFNDDAVWYGLSAIILHYIFWCGGSYMLYKDMFGCTKRPEQKLLKNRNAMEEAFARLDKDRDGILEMEEVLKAVEPPESLKKIPKASTCTLSSFILWSFFQNPLYTRIWLTNLDCAPLSGKNYMRHDLRVECNYNDEEFLMLSYVSLGCYGLFSIGGAIASLLFICKARSDTKRSRDEDGEITCDSESAYAFMLSGLRKGFWWFSSWKMLLKEILPILILADRYDKGPMDPGVGNAPAVLAFVGVFLGMLHEQLHPFDRLYRLPLGTIERLSWIAFSTAPLVKLMIGNRIEVAVDKGTAYVGQWTKVAESWFEYSLLVLAVITWMLPFAAAVYFIAGEELGFTRVHTVNIEVAERIHVTLPPKGRERRQLCKSMAGLFEHACLSVARTSDDIEFPTITPASCIEGALLCVMREDAAYWGDAQAGEHASMDVEHESMLWTIGSLQRDRQNKDMSLCRTIIDAGGLAETCLKQGVTINGLKVPEKDLLETGPLRLSKVEDAGEVTVIFFCFALERLELRSAGYKEGERKRDFEANQCRPAVLRALERGIAVAVACGEQALDVRMTPVGLDRALVTVALKCSDVQEMQIREEWLRTSLGTKDSRNRWCKGMETDLARVGVTGSEGKSLMVRFSKGSKPQRTTDEGAIRLMSAAVRAASLGLDRAAADYSNKEEKKAAQPQNHASVDPDHDDLDPFDNEGLGFLKVANLANSKGRGRQVKSERANETPLALGEVEGARRRGAGKGRGKGKRINSAGPVLSSA